MERSSSGFVVSYLGCPVMWKLKLQKEKCFRYTDIEYITLSQELGKTITIIELLK